MGIEQTLENVYTPQYANLGSTTGMAFYSGPNKPNDPHINLSGGPNHGTQRNTLSSGPAPIGTHTQFQAGSYGSIRQTYDFGEGALQERFDFKREPHVNYDLVGASHRFNANALGPAHTVDLFKDDKF